jgi:hypothetical protein
MEYANLDLRNIYRGCSLLYDFSVLYFIMQKKATILFVTFILFASNLFAQGCSMCKAVAETSVAGGNSQGSGLNAGILYIMVFPYILIGVGFYFWYRHKKALEKEQ